ncbi:MAG: transglutaminase domain-containing protein [Bacteroidota bacterium]
MKALITGLTLVLLALSSSAQKSPIKYGEIPMEDMKMTIYDKDSSAAAVILADYGEAYLQVTAITVELAFERHTRIKILKKEGLNWADVGVKLYHVGSTEERLLGLKATTYNLENGKIVETKMSKDNVFKEKFNKYINLQKFTLPNVKEGSVIEYSYKIASEFFSEFPNWQFQRTIPTRHSEFWAIIPDIFMYEKYMQGYVQVTNYEVKDKSQADFRAQGHHWVVKDVPAFKEEPFMTSEEDYISRMNFALSHYNFPHQPVKEVMGSWKKLNDDLLESDAFGRTITGSNFLKKKVDELTAGMTDPLQKITALHNFVKQEIEWDGEKDLLADNPKDVLEKKKGTTGDINLLLASMLEKAGLEVDMVLVSTRDHGFVRQSYPMRRQFNYVVCLVRNGDKNIWLDATEKYLPVNVLPERCLNGQGLVISKKNHGWINLDSKTKAKTVVNADLVLDKDGSLKGKLNFSRDGYDACSMRKLYAQKGQETYLNDFLGSKTWQVEKSEFQNIKEVGQLVKENHELTITEHVAVAGDVMYINPFVTSQIVSNPFKSEQRVYPVDFGAPIDKMYMAKIAIPEGYTVDEIPQSRILVLPGNAAKYVYNVAKTDNMVNITSSFQINRNIFTQVEYPDLREFYNQVVAKQAEQIVLKKK